MLLGAVFFAFFGAWVNSLTGPGALALILAGIIIFAGVYTLARWHGMPQPAFAGHPRAQNFLLLTLGAIAGFGSGLTGVGGPACGPLCAGGFPALARSGQPGIQIGAAVSGTSRTSIRHDRL